MRVASYKAEKPDKLAFSLGVRRHTVQFTALSACNKLKQLATRNKVPLQIVRTETFVTNFERSYC